MPTTPNESPIAEVLCGINAIREALRGGICRIERVWVAERKGGVRVAELLGLAAAHNIKVETLPEQRLTAAAGTSAHQGVVAFSTSTSLLIFEELVARTVSQHPVPPLVLLDGLKDPRNLGSIVRSAAAFRIGGLILPRRRAVGITATVAKAAAGGLEHVAIAEVANITQSLERLKGMGFWVVGADERGEVPCDAFAFPSPLALAFGEEGRGLSPLVKRHCDVLVRVPFLGELRSLNVAVAAAIFFYELMRQQGEEERVPTASRPPRPRSFSL